VCNCTVDTCTNLITTLQSTTGKIGFTNSIFSSLNSKGSFGSLVVSGNHNGFYNSSSATFGSGQVSITSNPYIKSGAGNYYLSPTNTAVLTAGITNIGGPLLSK